MADGGGYVIAHGDRSVAAREIRDSTIFTGDIVLHVAPGGDALIDKSREMLRPTPKPLATPVFVYQPPASDHVDRHRESATLLARATTGSPVNVYGEVGIGKSYVMAYAAAHPDARGAPEGVVHISGLGKGRTDLLQTLYEQFYEVPNGYKPREEEIRRGLSTKDALVIIDDFELDGEEVGRFFAASRSRFVVASQQRQVWNGTPLHLEGLAVDDALTLMERELERPLTDTERSTAETIYNAIERNTARIRPVAALSKGDDGLALNEVARRLSGAGALAASVGLIVDASTMEEWRVLQALAVFESAPVDAGTVRAVAGVRDVEPSLASLQERGLVEAVRSHYRLRGLTSADVEARSDLDKQVVRAVDRLAEWAASNPSSNEVLDTCAAILTVLQSARRRRRHKEVIRLGVAVSAAIALSRQWGAWADVLDTVLTSARHVGDRRAEAWALHHIGTIRVCLGERQAGVKALEEALRIREHLGDKAGEAATRHNLVQLRRRRPIAALPVRMPVALFALAILTGLAGGGALWGSRDPEPPSRSLSLSVVGAGTGRVVSAPLGIDCGAACSSEFERGTELALTAAAGPGSAFAGWRGGGCSGVRTCTLRLFDRASVIAEFRVAESTGMLEVVRRGSGTGTVTSTPTGVDCGPVCRASFERAPVTLLATAHPGSMFTGWEGGGCSGSGLCEVGVSRDTAVHAVFERVPDARTLTVRRDGPGRGTVSSSPDGLNCGVSCTASFAAGKTVTLNATAESGSAFDGWVQGPCAEIGRCTVAMDANILVVARFRLAPEARGLTVTKSGGGSGSVTSSPTGIDCGLWCSANFNSGTQVALSARAEPGSVFAGWSGGGCSGTDICTVALNDSSVDVTATFSPATVTRTLLVSSTGQGKGLVSSSPGGIDCGTSCRASLPDNVSIELRASPRPGSIFAGWSHPPCGGAQVCNIVLRQNMEIIATFNPAPVPTYSLSVLTGGDGQGVVVAPGIKCPLACKSSFPQDTEVTLTVEPGPRSLFSGWSDPRCGISVTCRVLMSASRSVTATFVAGYLLTVNQSGDGDVKLQSAVPGSPTIQCPTSCARVFRKNDVVTITASPAPNHYVLWTPPCEEFKPSCTVTMSADRERTVQFNTLI